MSSGQAAQKRIEDSGQVGEPNKTQAKWSGCNSVGGEIGIRKTCNHFLGKAWRDLGSLLMLVALQKP